MQFKEVRANIRKDCERYCSFDRNGQPLTRLRVLSTLLRPGVLAVALYRLAHWFHVKRWRRMARTLYLLNLTVTGCDISPECRIGPGCVVVHPCGIVLFGTIGNNATLFPRVIVAPGSFNGNLDQAPVLGHNVTLASMTTVLGAIHLADNTSVMPFSLVDFPVHQPGTIVRRLAGEAPVYLKKRAPEGSSLAVRSGAAAPK